MICPSKRIRLGDCLYELFLDLQLAAKGVSLIDADRRERWFDAGGSLLSQVPDLDQRRAWALILSACLPQATDGCSYVAAGEMLRRAEMWR